MSSFVKTLSGRSATVGPQIRAAASRLAAVEIWIVVILVASTLVFPGLLPWTLAVAGLFWGIRYLARGRFASRTPADWPIGLFILMLPVTLWVTALPDITWLAVYRLLTGIALYYAIASWVTSPRQLRLLRSGMVLLAVFLALAALVSVDWSLADKLSLGPGSLPARLPPLVSDPINPNVMAGSLVILMPCALGLLVYGWGHMPWRYLVLTGVGMLIVVTVLLLTQSRGGLLSLGLTLILMMLMRWKKSWLLLVWLILPGMVVATMLGPETILQVLATGHTLDTVDTRLEVWSRALYIIGDFPLTGSGMGSFQAVTQVLYPFFTTSRAIPHAHNLFLQVAVDLGLPGLVAWLAIWLIATLASWQVYRYGCSIGHWEVSGLGAGLFCSQLALVAHGLVDAVTWGAVRPAVILWALWAFSMASWKVCKTGLWVIDRPGEKPTRDCSGSSLRTET